MAKCDIEKLQNLLLEILERSESQLGIPQFLLKQELRHRAQELGMSCSPEKINRAIQQLLDKWLIDKILASLSSSLEEELDFHPPACVWHLKKITSEKRKKYTALEPVEKALIRILWKQNNPDRPGQIPVEQAERLLAEKGFTEIPEFIWIEDVVDDFFAFHQGEDIRWYGIIEEYKKTDDYKENLEILSEGVWQKEAWRLESMKDAEDKKKKDE